MMKYRMIPRAGVKVSEIGLGGEHVGPKDAATVKAVVEASAEAGMNLFELFMPQGDIRDKIGAALRPYRENVYLMGHIGATLTADGQYMRSRDPVHCEKFVDDFLRRYDTDRIDFGMMHYIDSEEDYKGAFETPYIDYVRKLKERGKTRFLGASSHVASTAIKIVESGMIDLLLFSINPAQDILPENIGNDAYFEDETYRRLTEHRLDPTRQRLYELCAKKGVGIAVMKALGCGRMLTSENGFGGPLTPWQCFRYALTRPGTASVVVGCTSPEHVREAAAYCDAPNELTDFGDLMSGTVNPLRGKCMYCNHCLPCPQNIDIAAVTRALDTKDAEAYAALAADGADCVACGQCVPNCPFGIDIPANMEKAARFFAE